MKEKDTEFKFRVSNSLKAEYKALCQFKGASVSEGLRVTMQDEIDKFLASVNYDHRELKAPFTSILEYMTWVERMQNDLFGE